MSPSPRPRRTGRFSARLKIGVGFSALGLLLFAGVGALSGWQVRQGMMRSAGAGLSALAHQITQTLDAGMFERHREIQNLAAFQGTAGLVLKPAGWRGLVDRLQASFPSYSWIGVADTQGKVLAATRGLLEGQDVSQRPWFAKGRQQPFVGDVHEALLLARLLPGEDPREPLRLVDFSAPIEHEGKVVGVLGAHLSWKWAEARRADAMRWVEPWRRVEVVILDEGGGVLMGPATPALPRTGRADLQSLVARGPAVTTWGDGRPYLTAAVRAQGYQTYRGLGWTVVVRQPLETATQEADDLQRRVWVFGLAGALLFGAVGWWLAGRLTAPLRRVARQAWHLAHDEHGGPAGGGPPEHDEVALLAASLGDLMAQLHRRQGELLELNETLEARVEARTEALKQVNADLESFSRSVSHDLKGPIGSIGAATAGVLRREQGRLEEPSQRMLSLVVEECERLRTLIDELMMLAMVEQRPLSDRSVSLQGMVDAVVAEVRRARGDEAVAVEVVVGDLPDVAGDEVLLRQVWLNLISNAFKFSSKALAPRVEISAERAGQEWIFRVKDNGAGFDMRQADRLFGVFQRLHSGKDFPGTGVGLTIVKRVVHRHGGRVWAEGAPGKGATFYFTLPAPPVAGRS